MLEMCFFDRNERNRLDKILQMILSIDAWKLKKSRATLIF